MQGWNQITYHVLSCNTQSNYAGIYITAATLYNDLLQALVQVPEVAYYSAAIYVEGCNQFQLIVNGTGNPYAETGQFYLAGICPSGFSQCAAAQIIIFGCPSLTLCQQGQYQGQTFIRIVQFLQPGLANSIPPSNDYRVLTAMLMVPSTFIFPSPSEVPQQNPSCPSQFAILSVKPATNMWSVGQPLSITINACMSIIPTSTSPPVLVPVMLQQLIINGCGTFSPTMELGTIQIQPSQIQQGQGQFSFSFTIPSLPTNLCKPGTYGGTIVLGLAFAYGTSEVALNANVPVTFVFPSPSAPSAQQQPQQGGSYTPPGAQPTKSQPTASNVPPSAPSQPNQPAIQALVFAVPDVGHVEAVPNVQLSDLGSIVTLINKVKEYMRAYDKEYAKDSAELAQYLEQLLSSATVAMQTTQTLPPPPPLPSRLAQSKYIKMYKLQPEQQISDVIEVPPMPKVGSHTGALVVIYFIPTTLLSGSGMASTGAEKYKVGGYVVPLSSSSTNAVIGGAAMTTFGYETVFVPQLGITITGTSTASGVPGQTLTLQYVVTNQSNVPATITLQVTDNYGTSITRTQSASACSASPCPSVTFNVQYTIPFNAQPNTSYTVTATATATYQNASTQPVSTTTTINVLSQQQVALTTLSVVPSQTLICATPGSSVTIGATITNASNAQQQVTVELLSQGGNVVNSQQLTVPAQGSAQVSFNLIAPQQLGFYYYQVAVVVGSQLVSSSYVAVDVSATCTAATVAPAATPTTAPAPATAQIQQIQQVMQVMLVMMLLNIFTTLTTALQH
jgi:hypothetical protein